MTVNLNLQDLMPVLPAVLGLLVAGAVSLVTKATAPAPLKRTVAAALAILAGVIPTVTLTPHVGPRVYVAAVLSAWVVALTTHAAGLTGWVQSSTAGFGIGPSVPVPADGTDGMTAGALVDGQQFTEFPQLPTDPEPADAAPSPVMFTPPALPAAPADAAPSPVMFTPPALPAAPAPAAPAPAVVPAPPAAPGV